MFVTETIVASFGINGVDLTSKYFNVKQIYFKSRKTKAKIINWSIIGWNWQTELDSNDNDVLLSFANFSFQKWFKILGRTSFSRRQIIVSLVQKFASLMFLVWAQRTHRLEN